MYGCISMCTHLRTHHHLSSLVFIYTQTMSARRWENVSSPYESKKLLLNFCKLSVRKFSSKILQPESKYLMLVRRCGYLRIATKVSDFKFMKVWLSYPWHYCSSAAHREHGLCPPNPYRRDAFHRNLLCTVTQTGYDQEKQKHKCFWKDWVCAHVC